jgi:hypothetical protein
MTLLLPKILYSIIKPFIKIMDIAAYIGGIHRERIIRRTDLLAFIPFLPGNHCDVIQLSFGGQQVHSNINLFLDTRLASRWLIYP